MANVLILDFGTKNTEADMEKLKLEQPKLKFGTLSYSLLAMLTIYAETDEYSLFYKEGESYSVWNSANPEEKIDSQPFDLLQTLVKLSLLQVWVLDNDKPIVTQSPQKNDSTDQHTLSLLETTPPRNSNNAKQTPSLPEWTEFPESDGSTYMFWNDVVKFLKDYTKRDRDVLVIPFCRRSLHLWLFLKPGDSVKFGNLCKTQNEYRHDFKVEFQINDPSETTEKDAVEIKEAAIKLLKTGFNNECYELIQQCVNNGCTLLIHGENSKNQIEVLSAINFCLTPYGIFINWLRTKQAKFNTMAFSHGDNDFYEGRGLGFFLIEQIFHFSKMLATVKVIDSSAIYLKAPKDNDGDDGDRLYSFYTNIGFTAIKKFPTGIMNFSKQSNGQVMDFKDKAPNVDHYNFFVLWNEPKRKMVSRSSRMLSEEAIFNNVVESMGGRRRNRNGANVSHAASHHEEWHRYCNEIVKLSRDSGKKSFRTILLYLQKLKEFFKKHRMESFFSFAEDQTDTTNSIFGDVVVNFAIRDPNVIEQCLMSSYTSISWNDDRFKISEEDEVKIGIGIGAGTLANLLPPFYLTNDLIQASARLITRNNSVSHSIAILYHHQFQCLFDLDNQKNKKKHHQNQGCNAEMFYG